MRLRLAVLAAALLALLVSAGQAVASDGEGSAQQAAGQAAGGGQAAGALSGASQSHPGNQNISVRVLSPGNAGSVTQTNAVSSNATAANGNLTGQSADQNQGSPCGCEGGTQAIGQSASNDQAAAALSLATQAGASNSNVPVRVLSDGNDGSVEQANSVDSDATAANVNATGQSADQSGADGTQAIGQSVDSEQDAAAVSKAEQTGAKNTNISVRVLSPGDDGDVSQSNTVESDATAANLNLTGQHADQAQSGAGGTQASGQSAKSDQKAAGLSVAKQHGASNTNVPVRVLSPGDGGKLEQSNSVKSDATAANLNATKQDADQSQSGSGCGCSSDGTQAIGQSAKNEQAAIALSAALQSGASNANTPVRVDSKGDEGSVSQSNSVDSDAKALNANLVKQDADQTQSGQCGCHGAIGIQAIGQESKNDQSAAALSAALQFGASNSNAPVRVDSSGHGGDVEQTSSVESDATAANLNALHQDADQTQAGGAGVAIQAIGQSAKNEQAAAGFSAALQSGASNGNTPVRVDSKGDDRNVSQSSNVDSDAKALNVNLAKQDAEQVQSGRRDCGCDGIGIQAIGQESKSEQAALAVSLAAQVGGHGKCGCSSDGSSSTPVRVGSPGHEGSLDQSNTVDSDATAANLNLLGQRARQGQGGAGGIQAIGQSAKNRQAAVALSLALQLAGWNRKPLLEP